MILKIAKLVVFVFGAFLISGCATQPTQFLGEDRGTEVLHYYRGDKTQTEFLVLIPGGKGQIRKANNKAHLRNNTLLRSYKRLARKGYEILVLGAPRFGGYEDEDRFSYRHAKEIQRLIKKYNKRNLPVYAIGSSRGTLSALNLAKNKEDIDLRGVVLMSSVVDNAQFKRFNLERIKVPQLFVHHKADACRVSSLKELESHLLKLQPNPYRQLVVLEGGNRTEKNPCGGLSHHGFYGVEKKVVTFVRRWITNKGELKLNKRELASQKKLRGIGDDQPEEIEVSTKSSVFDEEQETE